MDATRARPSKARRVTKNAGGSSKGWPEDRSLRRRQRNCSPGIPPAIDLYAPASRNSSIPLKDPFFWPYFAVRVGLIEIRLAQAVRACSVATDVQLGEDVEQVESRRQHEEITGAHHPAHELRAKDARRSIRDRFHKVLPGAGPLVPQSARREDEGEAPEPAERPECPDEEEAAGGLRDLAVMRPPHVQSEAHVRTGAQ